MGLFAVVKDHSEIYSEPNWDVAWSCGKKKSKCGEHCPSNSEFNCFSVQNYCWSLYKEGEETLDSYQLKLISLIFLFTFGGRVLGSDHLGFTVLQKHNNQSFASNAMIIDLKLLKIFLIYIILWEKIF